MTSMDDLIAFISARLDDDERQARGLFGEEWEAIRDAPDEYTWTVCHRPEPLVIEGRADVWREDMAKWIEGHDPARVLREVEAKRMLLEQFQLRGNSVRSTVQPATGGVWDDLLRMLAHPWSDHPDCRSEWKQ